MYIEKNTIIATADGQNIKQIVLPDGTKVWLNKNTTLSYPKTFEDDKRNVELNGEAYFEVVKNPHKPFTVNSEAMDVRVLGTVFNFRTSGRNDLAEVSLLEGSVQVKGNNDEGVINIKPGQKVILDKINHCMIVQQTNTSLDAVWHNKMIPLENMNIHSIARILEHLYHVHITVASNVDAKMTYSGTIKYNETIDSVLTALRYSIPFEYRIDGNEVYIKK
jgi:transmembrane sensor